MGLLRNNTSKTRTIVAIGLVAVLIILAGCASDSNTQRVESSEEIPQTSISYDQGTPNNYGDDVTVKIYEENNMVCYWEGMASGGMGCVQSESLTQKYLEEAKDPSETLDSVSISHTEGEDVTVKVYPEDNVVCHWEGQASGGMGCIQNETLTEEHLQDV